MGATTEIGKNETPISMKPTSGILFLIFFFLYINMSN